MDFLSALAPPNWQMISPMRAKGSSSQKFTTLETIGNPYKGGCVYQRETTHCTQNGLF
jgi:hypothetical protein